MKSPVLFFVFGVTLETTVPAQTVIPGGVASGTWELSGSPYLIEGEINIASGSMKLGIIADDVQ